MAFLGSYDKYGNKVSDKDLSIKKSSSSSSKKTVIFNPSTNNLVVSSSGNLVSVDNANKSKKIRDKVETTPKVSSEPTKTQETVKYGGFYGSNRASDEEIISRISVPYQPIETVNTDIDTRSWLGRLFDTRTAEEKIQAEQQRLEEEKQLNLIKLQLEQEKQSFKYQQDLLKTNWFEGLFGLRSDEEKSLRRQNEYFEAQKLQESLNSNSSNLPNVEPLPLSESWFKKNWGYLAAGGVLLFILANKKFK